MFALRSEGKWRREAGGGRRSLRRRNDGTAARWRSSGIYE